MAPAKRSQTKVQIIAQAGEDVRDPGMKKIAEIKEKKDAFETHMVEIKATEKLNRSFLACGCLYLVFFALAAGFSHAYRDLTPVPRTFKKSFQQSTHLELHPQDLGWNCIATAAVVCCDTFSALYLAFFVAFEKFPRLISGKTWIRVVTFTTLTAMLGYHSLHVYSHVSGPDIYPQLSRAAARAEFLFQRASREGICTVVLILLGMMNMA